MVRSYAILPSAVGWGKVEAEKLGRILDRLGGGMEQ